MKGLVNISRRKIFGIASKISILAPVSAVSSALPSRYLQSSSEQSQPRVNRRNIIGSYFRSKKLELIRLLKEIAEIEHSLMLQYLYAGLSIRSEYASLAGTGTPDSSSFLGVAVQEMHHLSKVNQLLVELGASPSLQKQDFPYEYEIYPFPFSLEPLSRKSVAKYVVCESPPFVGSGATLQERDFQSQINQAIGQGVRINRIGSVYSLVISMLDDLTVKEDIKIDRAYWMDQLKDIMEEGEDNHFLFFKSVFLGTHDAFKNLKTDWWLLNRKDKLYPSYDSMSNPSAVVGNDNEIEVREIRELAWLGNLYYWTTLMLLDSYYRTQIDELRQAAVVLMMGPFKSLGTELAKRGYGMPFDTLSLGSNPCIDQESNLSFSRDLLKEVESFSREIVAALPADYPEGIESYVLKLIQK